MDSSASLFNFRSLLLPSQKNPPQIISTPSYCDSFSSSTTTTAACSVSFLNRRNGFVPITSSIIQKSENDDILAGPSLAYSKNTLYCTAYHHVEMYVDEDEPVESLILRFKRASLRARVIQECKRRRFHETSQEKKKRKSRDAARRNRSRRTPWRGGGQMEDEEALKEEEEEKKKKSMDDDNKDNWEYYEGGIPYY